MDGFQEIKKYLLSKQREVATKLQLLNEEESRLSDVTPESSELGTSSWQADIDSTKQAIKQRLLDFSQKIQNTLLKFQNGTYGICDKCKRGIEKERLEIIPIASHCIKCLN